MMIKPINLLSLATLVLFLAGFSKPAVASDPYSNLVTIANEMNKTVPRQVDQITVLVRVVAKPNLFLEYIYEIKQQKFLQVMGAELNLDASYLRRKLINRFGSIEKVITSKIKDQSRQSRRALCSNPAADSHYLLKRGVTFKHVFYNEQGLYLGSYQFNQASCQ